MATSGLGNITLKICETHSAASYSGLPAWFAVIRIAPGPFTLNSLPSMETGPADTSAQFLPGIEIRRWAGEKREAIF